MLTPGDYAIHQRTGSFGKVIGYGHQILNSVYLTTLKVLVTAKSEVSKKNFVEEDLVSAWLQIKSG